VSEASPGTNRWRRQHELLATLEAAVSRALEEIGAGTGTPLGAAADLIGFGAGPAAAQEPLLLGPIGKDTESAARLVGALGGGSDQGWGVEVQGEERCFFVGVPAPVQDRELHPVLSFDRAALGELAGMVVHDADGAVRRVSLVHEVIAELLRAGSMALLATRWPSQGTPSLEQSPTEVARRAARRMVNAIAGSAGTEASGDLFDTFDGLASMAYEGRAGRGGVVLMATGHEEVEVALRLREPVSARNFRKLRKLLELTGPRLDLLTDGRAVQGLGRIRKPDDTSSPPVFRFEVVRQGEWRLSHRGQDLLEVDHGRPLLPRSRNSFAWFRRTMQRVFPDSAEHDVETIWQLAQSVRAAPYGAMLVVSRAAEQEAARLAGESLVIEPRRIDADLLESLTRIDGAVLLTPDCVCHGIGVILDGIATGTGDRARGARYNSAVRYETTAPAPCVILIVSEDGMIDLHPQLEETASPEDAEVALAELERVAAREPVDLNLFFKASGRLRMLTSSLSPEQCARANAIWRRLAAQHEARTGLPLVVVPFVPRGH
jgi:hypothetical protein